ncbi:MAG: hypothetical protein K0Q96_2154 [Rubrobacteraceae bacterium]|nr:hypothetical protein [Rubrobacteraceae bacterium]
MEILKPGETFVQLRFRAAPLNDQDGFRIPLYKAGRVPVDGVGPRAAYRDVVEQLYRRRVHLQEQARGAGRRGESVELERGQGAGFGERTQPEPRAGDHGQRALGATDQAREVQGLGVDEGVEAVAGDATDHLGEPTLYLVVVALPDLHGPAQQPRERIGVTGAPSGLLPAEGSKLDRLPRGEHAA